MKTAFLGKTELLRKLEGTTDPFERAELMIKARDKAGLRGDEFARMMGVNRSTLMNELRMAKVPEIIRAMHRNGALSLGHVRALLPLKDTNKMIVVAAEVLRGDRSCRWVEKRVKERVSVTKPQNVDLLNRIVRAKKLAADRKVRAEQQAERLKLAAGQYDPQAHLPTKERKKISDAKRPPREELRRLVWRRPITALRQRYGVGSRVVRRWCMEMKIPRPDARYWYDRKQLEIPPDLQYRVLKLGVRGAGKYFGVDENTMQKLCKRAGAIKRVVRPTKRPPRHILQSLVWARSQEEIAEIYGVPKGSVWAWTRYYDLEMPDPHHWLRKGVDGAGNLINPTVKCECGCGTDIKYWKVYSCGKKERRRFAPRHRPGTKAEPEVLVSDEKLLEEKAYQIAVELGGERFWQDYIGEAWLAIQAERVHADDETKEAAAKTAIKAQKKQDFAMWHMKEYSELPPDKA